MEDTAHKAAIALFLIFSFPILSTSQICSESSCGGQNEPSVRFPFRVQRIQPAGQCGYPGFELICAEDSLTMSSQTVVELPNSGQFSVRSIDYASQEIWLNDPHNCLPRRLLTLNLSGSPFRGANSQDFRVFMCSNNNINAFDYNRLGFNPIACLGGPNYTVVATSSERAVRLLQSNSCSSMSTISVPVGLRFTEQVWTSDLSEDIRLTWDAPLCGSCESIGGICRLRSNSSFDVVCSSPRRLPRGARIAVGVGAGVVAFLLIAGLACLSFIRARSLERRRREQTVEFAPTVAPRHILITGLDGPTIESYPKTLLGESRRLPKPDDNMCSICLCEYKPKETLRAIPACQHCFHAECIDEWLRLNATCPVCRNSPRQSQPALDS